MDFLTGYSIFALVWVVVSMPIATYLAVRGLRCKNAARKEDRVYCSSCGVVH